MTSADFAELRRIIDLCLDGTERAQDDGARFAELMALYWEANYQAKLKGQRPLPEFLVRTQFSAEEKRRLAALFEASLGEFMPRVEWLPLDDNGTA
jgi:hypothetical protein